MNLWEQLNNLPLNQRIALYVMIPLFGVFCFWYFYYSPTKQDIVRLKSSIQQSQDKLRQLKLANARFKKLKKEIAIIEAEYRKISIVLPREKEIPSLLASISSMGIDSHLEFMLFQPQKEKIQDFYAEVPILLKLKGRFLDLMNFFKKIASAPRIVNITSLNIRRLNSKQAPELSIELHLMTYRFIPEIQRKVIKSRKRKRR